MYIALAVQAAIRHPTSAGLERLSPEDAPPIVGHRSGLVEEAEGEEHKHSRSQAAVETSHPGISGLSTIRSQLFPDTRYGGHGDLNDWQCLRAGYAGLETIVNKALDMQPATRSFTGTHFLNSIGECVNYPAGRIPRPCSECFTKHSSHTSLTSLHQHLQTRLRCVNCSSVPK